MAKFRHEIKFYITYSDYLGLTKRLEKVIDSDKNTKGKKKYKIRSLYFDNVYNKNFDEKVEGHAIRGKFRIRYYNNNHDYIMLERKAKIHGLCLKDSERITKEECLNIINGNIEFLKTSGKRLFLDLYNSMKFNLVRPKVIVDYTREPYTYKIGNVRITFDMDVKSGLRSIKMFENIPTVAAINPKLIILEVKYDSFLPSVIRDIINLDNRNATSISKFEACRGINL